MPGCSIRLLKAIAAGFLVKLSYQVVPLGGCIIHQAFKAAVYEEEKKGGCSPYFNKASLRRSNHVSTQAICIACVYQGSVQGI